MPSPLTIDFTALVQMARLIGYAGVLNEPRAAMGKLKTVEELFKGRHFDRDVVILYVIPPSCAGCSATHRSSRNAGDDLPG
jgi:hypothetical protein